MTNKIKDQKKIDKTINFLNKKEKILFITTSNRWGKEKAKSTKLAEKIAGLLGSKVKIIDVSKLKIFPCEGNISSEKGNNCGVIDCRLLNKKKNPSTHHRCWASINNPSDELWQISKELLTSDCVVFFGSVRWGQMNSIYQKLIERLSWLENRHTTLKEENILKKIEAGIIVLGHNWRAQEVLKTQEQVLKYFGFKVAKDLCWFWQFTQNSAEESAESYKKAAKEFNDNFLN